MFLYKCNGNYKENVYRIYTKENEVIKAHCYKKSIKHKGT